jgi:ribonucleoside-diphosphate reductase subunit M1
MYAYLFCYHSTFLSNVFS